MSKITLDMDAEDFVDLKGLSEKTEALKKSFMRQVDERREEILTAFVAKYGYDPDEVVLCHQIGKNGELIDWVEKDGPADGREQRVYLKGKTDGISEGYDKGFKEGCEEGFSDAEEECKDELDYIENGGL